MTLGKYQHQDELREMDQEWAALAELLTDLGAPDPRPWPTPPTQGTLTEVTNRLEKEWAGAPTARNSMLIWLGHGESTGNSAKLATYDSLKPIKNTAFLVEHMADLLRSEWLEGRAGDSGAWTIVVIEACGARTFIQVLAGKLLSEQPQDCPQRTLLIGVGGDGQGYLGQFRTTLHTFLEQKINDEVIRLSDLYTELEARIGDDGRVMPLTIANTPPIPLHRRPAVTAPMDVAVQLQRLLSELPADLRLHFLPKAQGAEQGELAWYFVGRHAERRRIATWLREARAGMLVVTGRAGSGKSALLGNLVLHTQPGLRALWQQLGELNEPSELELPPPHAFDAVIHLVGLSVTDVVTRLADAAGLGPPPAHGPAGADIEWLLAALTDRGAAFTVLVDALDEAQQPLLIARAVLARLARLPHVRILVGTRSSTREGPDKPEPADHDLLTALGPIHELVELAPDPAAIDTYVHRRLTRARQERRLPAHEAALVRIAGMIAGRNQPFLFARLAVHEILARPELTTPDFDAELQQLISGEHRGLFAAAVGRLSAEDPRFHPLLEALALAQGRGLPRADQLWAVSAHALADHVSIGPEDIDRILTAAAPYIMIDAEDRQSVYRLAHRTFQEFFLTRSVTSSLVVSWRNVRR